MREQQYYLTAFQTLVDGLSCSAHFKQGTQYVEIDYRLRGDLSTVLLPAWDKTQAQQRKIGLWEHTCFECFIAVNNNTAYREFNFSPTGAWNAFAFTDYRQGMQEDNSVQRITQQRTTDGDCFSLNVKFICPEINLQTPLALNLTAVLAHSNGQSSYWAIQHPEKPDFHLRTCFQYFI